ncbi:hypothetical protein JZ751_028722, partial [Albula glossodonta]
PAQAAELPCYLPPPFCNLLPFAATSFFSSFTMSFIPQPHDGSFLEFLSIREFQGDSRKAPDAIGCPEGAKRQSGSM